MSGAADRDWDRRKRTLAWVHFAIQLVVLFGLLFMGNLLAQKFPRRYDLTSRRTYEVSTMAEDLLKNLNYDVEIWLNGELYSASEDKSLPTAIVRTKELLDEFRKRTTHVKVYVLDERNTPKLETFQKHFGLVTPATLFLLATHPGNRENQRQIDVPDLYEGDPNTGQINLWKGEPVLVQAIRDLGGATKKIIYESEGHREIVTADVRRMSTLANFLRLNEGVEFRRLPLADYLTIPVDCDLLMILAPEQPFLDHELDIIKEYLERGGSLLFAPRPKVKTGMERLLHDYSIDIGDNVVCDGRQYKPPYKTHLILADFNNAHPINRNMANVQFEMPLSCTVDPLMRRDPNWTITPLAVAGPYSWEEKGGTGPNDDPKPDKDERVGNMKVIVAVEKKADHPLDAQKHEKAKIVVWGSALPFTNALLPNPYVFQTIQGQYVVNQFRWLLDRQSMEFNPKKIVSKPLEMSGEALDRLKWIVVFGFPGFGVALGLLAWYLRRK